MPGLLLALAMTGGVGSGLGQTKCLPPPAGLVAWWPLDDATNQSTVVELVGNLHGTTRNAANAVVNIGLNPVWSLPDPSILGGTLAPVVTDPATSPPRGALFLSGGYVEVPHHPSLNIGPNGMTLTLWTWPTPGGGGPQPLVEKHDLAGADGYSLYLDPAGSGNFVLKFLLNGTVVSGPLVPASVSTSDWRFVVAHVDAAGSVTLAVCDAAGSCSSAPPVVVSGFMTTNTAPLWMGRGRAAFPVIVTAERLGLDEVEVFARGLSQAELQQIYEAERAGTRKCPPSSFTAELCIFKFHDLNGDGQQNANEPGLAGWQFQVSPTPAGWTTNVVTTLAGGGICFGVPGPGTYTITEIPQPGWTNTTPTTQTVTISQPGLVNVEFGNLAACVPPPPGLVAWWPLDEANGAAAFAELQAGLNASIVPGPLGSFPAPNAMPGQVAGGAYFPVGPLGYGDVPSNPALDVAGANFSIDAWIYPIGCGPQHVSPIVDKLRLGDPLSGYALGLLGGQLVLALGDPLAGGQLYTCTLSLALNSWNFVGVSVDFGAGTVTFYVNGAAQTLSAPPPSPKGPNASSLWIGGSRIFFASPPYPHCEIGLDELEIFNRALSTNELGQMFSAGPAGKCKTPCMVSITCPTNIVVSTCGDSAVVQYPPAQATSTCGLVPTVVCTPPSGSIFPLGTTTVTCTATVPGHTNTCTFTVTVLPDTTPPVLDCVCLTNAPSLPPLTVQGCQGIIPDLCEAALRCAQDNCGPITCSQSPPAGTPVGPGVHPITVTVTDGAGNSSSCVVNYTVVAPTTTRVWHTGVSGPTAANFTVIQTPGGPTNLSAVPTAVATGAWLPNGPTSDWISFTSNSQNAAPGLYVYRMTFNLGCTNGASLTGQILVDDAAEIRLNGLPTGQPTFSSYNTWAPVNLTAGFVPGLNTLDVYVTNAIIWTGLRAELTNTFNCCCPEAIIINCPTGLVANCALPGTLTPVPYTVTATNLCGAPVTVVCDPPSPGPFPAGTTTVTCTATDALGNSATCTFTVTVLPDTTPPVIACPSAITRVVCANGAVVHFKAKAKDNCPGPITVNCTPPSGSFFPVGTTMVTCTATDAAGNTSTCSFPVTVINNAVWVTLPRGWPDCYKASLLIKEPAVPGACLTNAYPGPFWKNFDDQTVNRWVGVTWNFPLSWNILGAWFNTRLRPPVNGCAGGSTNDSINLGLTSCGPPAWLWGRYLGSGNPSAGLFNFQWCNGSGCNYTLGFNLAALPLWPTGTVNLLPHMNSAKRLDMLVQDDTTVDFARLRVLRCLLWDQVGGLDTTPNNARLIHGPGVWVPVPEEAGAPFGADFTLDRTPGVLLPMEPLSLAGHPGAWLEFETLNHEDAPGIGLRLEGGDDGQGRVILSRLPAQVTDAEIELIVERDGAVIEQHPPRPVGAGELLATFDLADHLFELGVLDGDELRASILSPDEDGSAHTYTLRALLSRRNTPRGETDWDADGLPGTAWSGARVLASGLSELPLRTPELQLRAANRRGQVLVQAGNAPSLLLAQDDQVVATPLDPETGGADVRLRFSPTTEFRWNVDSSLYEWQEDEPLRSGLKKQKQWLPSNFRLKIDGLEEACGRIGLVEFEQGTNLLWSITMPGMGQPTEGQIQQVILKGLAGQTNITPQPAPAGGAVLGLCPELPPTRTARVSDPEERARSLHFRFLWPRPVRFQAADGREMEVIELEIVLRPPECFDGSLSGLSLEATGTDALVVGGPDFGPEDRRVHLAVGDADGDGSADEILILTTGVGGVLEEAPTVLGPWTPVLDQFEHGAGHYTVPLPPQGTGRAVRFYRVRY